MNSSVVLHSVYKVTHSEITVSLYSAHIEFESTKVWITGIDDIEDLLNP